MDSHSMVTSSDGGTGISPVRRAGRPMLHFRNGNYLCASKLQARMGASARILTLRPEDVACAES